MLTSKQRAEFRAQANSLETTLMVGKDGVTEAVVAEADKLLTARDIDMGMTTSAGAASFSMAFSLVAAFMSLG